MVEENTYEKGLRTSDNSELQHKLGDLQTILVETAQFVQNSKRNGVSMFASESTPETSELESLTTRLQELTENLADHKAHKAESNQSPTS